MCVSCSVVSDSFATPWAAARQAPLSMGFSREEYWRGLSCPPPPGDLPDRRIKSEPPALASRFFTTEPPGKPSHHTEPPTVTNSVGAEPVLLLWVSGQGVSDCSRPHGRQHTRPLCLPPSPGVGPSLHPFNLSNLVYNRSSVSQAFCSLAHPKKSLY